MTMMSNLVPGNAANLLRATSSTPAPIVDAAAKPVAKKRGRLIQLDILRGVAVLIVMGFHAPINWAQAGAFKPLAAFFTRFGWSGVDLFFVLSGFLVGGLLFEEVVRTNDIRIGRFLVRRTLKIWPLYFLFLAIMGFACAPRVGSIGTTFREMLPAFFFYANYHPMPVTGLDHMWSISVEEHFYLLLPLLFLISFRFAKSPRQALGIIATVGAIAVLTVATARTIVLWSQPFDPVANVERTHWRIDGLFFGVLLAYIFHVHPTIWNKAANIKLPLAILGFLLLTPCMFLKRVHDPFVWTVGYSLLYVGYGAILIAMMHTKFDGLSKRPGIRHALAVVAWVGLNSYPIYLWHLPLSHGLSHFAGPHLDQLPDTLAWLLMQLPYYVLSVVIGAWVGKFVERPTLAVRDRLFPAKAPALVRVPNGAADKTPEKLSDALVK